MNHTTSFFGKQWHARGKRSQTLWQDLQQIRQWSQDDMQPGDWSDFPNLETLPGLQATVEHISQAIQQKNKIVLYGDFDVDGVSGTALLYLAMKHIGADVTPKIPSRAEGYGLHADFYDKAAAAGVDIVITIDCGASNTDEIAYGNTLGIRTIVTDHHHLDHHQLPPAIAICHPHLITQESAEGISNAFHNVVGAGVAFIVAWALLRKHFGNNHERLLPQLVELAALGTVADIGPLQGANRTIVQLGLQELQKNQHPALAQLLSLAKVTPEQVTAETIGFVIGPRLNAAGRLDHPHKALALLLGNAEIATELEQLNHQRRDIVGELMHAVDDQIDTEQAAFVLQHNDFFGGVTGLIAGRVCEQYARPTITLAPTDKPDVWVGSCRSTPDYHIGEALKQLNAKHNFLIKHGGHAQAAGLSIAATNIDAFVQAFLADVHEKRGTQPPAAILEYDCEATITELTMSLIQQIGQASPFGAGNPEPTFALCNVQFSHVKVIGKTGACMVGEITQGNAKIKMIGFQLGTLKNVDWNTPKDVLVTLEKKIWNHTKYIQIRVVDVMECC